MTAVAEPRVRDRAANTDVPARRTPSSRELPYGPTMTHLLEPLHGAFLIGNPLLSPALERGFGALFSNP